jgi:dTDP-4-amino-4,6-dideoxygalactose transaminase
MADIVSVALMSVFISPYLYWFPHGLSFLKIGETKFYKDFPVFRLSGFKAGLLRHWRNTLDGYNRTRSEFGEFYLRELNLKGTLPIYSFPIPYLRFPIYVNESGLKGAYDHYRFFGVTRMYPDSVNNIKEIRNQFIGSDCKNAENIAETLLTLPTHSLIREHDRINLLEIAKNVKTSRNVFR